MKLPISSPDLLLSEIVQVVVAGPLVTLPIPVSSVEGTGFVVGDGVLVTCWHCLAAPPPENHCYALARMEGKSMMSSPLGWREQVKRTDLALGRANFAGTLGIRISASEPVIGTSVWTFGYPLTDSRVLGNGSRIFTSNPRLLRGHIVRAFVFEHPVFGNTPSWELSFPVPAGLSGAPLFLEDTLDVVGVLYGNNDVANVEEISSVDPVSGLRQPEIQRVMSFGLAHHLRSLAPVQQLITDGWEEPAT